MVLVNAAAGALVGPSNILNGALTAAHVGDVLTAYGTGFGPVTPPVSVTIGGVALASTDIQI